MRNRKSSLTQSQYLKGLLLRRNLMERTYLQKVLSANKKVKRGLERRPKSKFLEYLKMEMTKGVISAEDDMEIERSLAKKLKVKERKLGGLNDGLNVLITGITSKFGSEFNEFSVAEHDYDQNGSKVKTGKRKHDDLVADDEAEESEKEIKRVAKSKKHKWAKSSKAFVNQLEEQYPVNKTIDFTEYHVVSNAEESPNEKPKPDASVKYVAPHLRAITKSESEELAHIRRRVRGFLNKLSESNVESIAGEVAAIFQSVTRSVGCEIVGTEIVASCVGGPRGNEQYAAVFAAFVAGMACFVGIDFSAKLLASIARSFEEPQSPTSILK